MPTMNVKFLVGRTAYNIRDWFLARSWLPLINYVPFDRCWPYDVARYAGRRNFATIVDVGANVGQTARYLRGFFRTATIHCFEPIPLTFQELKRRTANDANIQAHPVALSNQSGSINMIASDFSETSAVTNLEGDFVSKVIAQTLDEFAMGNGISQIDLLKIDVEGHELAVLEGARKLLSTGKVQAIYIEFGTDSTDIQHTHLSKIHSALEPYGFVFSGIYEAYRLQPRYRMWFGNALYWNARFLQSEAENAAT
ncbi:MAG TPA: FkbM family methyltransferase [Opitutaceae bacterium]